MEAGDETQNEPAEHAHAAASHAPRRVKRMCGMDEENASL